MLRFDVNMEDGLIVAEITTDATGEIMTNTLSLDPMQKTEDEVQKALRKFVTKNLCHEMFLVLGYVPNSYQGR